MCGGQGRGIHTAASLQRITSRPIQRETLFRRRLLIEVLASHQFGCSCYKWTRWLFSGAWSSWPTLSGLFYDAFRGSAGRCSGREGGKSLTFMHCVTTDVHTEPCAAYRRSISIKREAGWRLLSFFSEVVFGSGERLWSRVRVRWWGGGQHLLGFDRMLCMMSSWHPVIRRTIVCKGNNIWIWQVPKNLF